MKEAKPPKTHLICPKEKCKASNAPDASECLLCKTSLENAESILVADDAGYLPNYMSGSGFLFFIFVLYYFKDSWLTSLFFVLGIILMAPIVLRKTSQKMGRKHPNILIRTVLATIIFFIGLVISPSEEQMEANEAERQKAITAQAVAEAEEEKAKPTPEATIAPTAEPTPSPTPGEKLEVVLKRFQTNIVDSGVNEFVEDISMDKYVDNRVVVTISNAVLYQPKEIKLQFAQNLWKQWATECIALGNIKDIDSCRIKLVDINGNQIAVSSMWGGSIIKLK